MEGGGLAFLKLALDGCDLSADGSLDDVGELIHLQVVELKDTKVADPSPLGQLPGLRHLDLQSNSLAALPVLPKQRFLQVLKLPNNSIATLSSMKAHPYLHTLDLAHNQLSTLSGLESGNLKFLNVEHNQLTALEGLKCPALHTVHASHNKIEKVAGNFAGVSELGLGQNNLSTLASFQREALFPVLHSLDLQENKIPGYGELQHLGAWWSHAKNPLPKLSKVCLAGNPWMLAEDFDAGKRPVEVLTYLPGLTALDELPVTEEDNEVPFPTPEQLEEAAAMRGEREESEKAEAEAERVRQEAEAARVKAEEEAAAAALAEAQEGQAEEE